MFSGIVECIGKIIAIDQATPIWRFSIESIPIVADLKIGDSVAINGVCLTVIDFHSSYFKVEVVPETQRCTNFFKFQVGDEVNLERSITANSRIGGHFMQGHVDTVCEVLAIKLEDSAWLLTLSLPKSLKPYVINKGFIGLDGMSITIIKVGEDNFTATLIPHTQAVTIAKTYKIGSLINVEIDMLGKYIVNYLETTHAQSI
ncbi:MAG: riboflavin synthase subunit alpha [Gammaproteobacteria bacterium RIFCSPHIGHO2_12_FULL_35_23]|nr:MAG: riboflavin synthase subunit alpha [Gammaproteobacteria bacterium RIFCSPHIGHO2_12_FULL_35_23]